MATVIDWPVGVPSCIMPLSAQGGLRDNRLSFDTDSKLNPIERPASSWAPEVYSVELTPLSVAQFEEFQRWYADDLRFGALPFYWSHPITGEPGVWKIQKADPPYRVSKRGLIAKGSGKRRVGLSFSVMSVPLDYWQNYIGSLFDGGRAGFWADSFAPSSRRVYKDTGSLIAAPGETARIVLGRTGGKAEQATSGARPTLGRAPISGIRNLYNFSEQLTNAAWTRYGSPSLTANAAEAPDGTMTAVRISSNLAWSHGLYQLLSVSGGQRISAQLCLKSETLRAGIQIRTRTGSTIVGQIRVVVALDGGSISTALSTGFTSVETSADFLGDGWVKITVSGITPAGVNDFFVMPSSPDTGDGSGTYLAWGAQVEMGAPSNYQKTTTRFDITEEGAGESWYLFDDGGDSLPLTLPAGTYGLAHWNEAAQLTIGTVTNPSDALVAERMAGIILRSGAFSAEDQAKIAAYVSSLNPS